MLKHDANDEKSNPSTSPSQSLSAGMHAGVTVNDQTGPSLDPVSVVATTFQ